MSYKDFYSSSGIPKPTNFGHKRKVHWPKKYINHFLSDFQDLEKVLEIGPGEGEFAVECKNQNWEYIGVELSIHNLSILKSKNINVIYARVPPIPVQNESFDLIHAEHVIEHFNNITEFVKFLNECQRVLRDGGILSLSYPNYNTQGKIFYDWSYSHQLPFTKNNLERACLDYNFKVVRADCHLSWFLSKNFIFRLLRYPFIWFAKIINFPILIEISDEIKALKVFRMRITKNCLDSVTIIARKES